MKTRSHLLLILSAGLLAACTVREPATLILTNGEIYTMEESQPWASTVLIEGNKIAGILGETSDLSRYKDKNTRIIDLKGKFVMPGFIDGHTHFDGFGAMLNDIDLLPVSDEKSMLREVRRVVAILQDDEWIVGEKWDAIRLWNVEWERRDELRKDRWLPTRSLLDPESMKNPCFFSTYGEDLFFANTAALKAAGIGEDVLEGMQTDNEGKTTGIIIPGSPAIDLIRAAVTEKSEERILEEMRAGLKELASIGIVEIQDITNEKYPELYAKLMQNGELSCRVWMRLDLARASEIAEKGLKMNTHPLSGDRDYYLRYGAFKGYMDGLMGSHGALLREPYTDRPETRGHYRDHSSDDPPGYIIPNLDKIYHLMEVATNAGFITNIHAIGDQGIDHLLELYRKLSETQGLDKVARSRVIHAQTVHDDMFDDFAELKLIAEVTPSNVQDDMRWIERRLGNERVHHSHRYNSFIQNGVVCTGGSDIPGAQGAMFDPHPRAMIHAVVNRTQDDGTPLGGWLPEEKVSMHDAIKMYTLDAAYACFDEETRGSVKVGKLADFTICDLNLMKLEDPLDILKMNVLMTVVDGKVVFEADEF